MREIRETKRIETFPGENAVKRELYNAKEALKQIDFVLETERERAKIGLNPIYSMDEIVEKRNRIPELEKEIKRLEDMLLPAKKSAFELLEEGGTL